MAAIARASPIHRSTNTLQCLRHPQSRCLSTSKSLLAAAAQAQGGMMKNMPKQQSIATRMKKLKRSEIPSDMGIFPFTYVRPCGNMPGLFSEPMTRLRLEWLYLKQSFMDFGRYYAAARWQQKKDPITGKRKKKPMRLRERNEAIRDLHSQLYTALATGDRNTINKISCSGLQNQQIGRLDRARISNAPLESWSVKYRGWVVPTKLYFTLQLLIPSYFKAVNVIVDRQMQVPIGPGVMVRQVVARVDSTQTLSKNDGSEPVTKKLREYVVIQRTLIEDDDGPWMIWGTINPSTTEEATEIITMTNNQGDSLWERVRNMMSGLSPSPR